jgi:type II secretory pathway pseudopilin PulG
MPAAPATTPDRDAGAAGANFNQLGAWLVTALFLVLGIGGGLIAWLRHGEGADIEQVISALAIAVVGILAAIVHGRALVVLRRAQQTEREIEREHVATRVALERAAAVPLLAGSIPEEGEDGPRAPEPKRRQDELLTWQIEQVAGNIEADAALIQDLKRTHGREKLAEAWRRSCSPKVTRAVAELADLVFPRKE